jgi:hypothetical protein
MGDLADRLGELASVPSRASRGAADRITDLIQGQYATGEDPYGDAWADLSERTLERHGPPPLTDTGDMADGSIAKPAQGAGIEITIPFPGGIHQTGARRGTWRMPKRPILPDGDEMPPAWDDAIAASARESFNGTMRGKGRR